MKKFFKYLLILFVGFNFIIPVNATNITINSNKQKLIYEYINQFNNEHGTNFHILNKNEFDNLSTIFNYNYNTYLKNLYSQDLLTIRNELNNALTDTTVFDVELNPQPRSVSATKKLYFYNGNNLMSLSYKHNGQKFDTTYKPKVSVTIINTQNYFLMKSHTGTFTSSNTNYRVVANGQIITRVGIVDNKSFTVNFTL